MKTIAVAFVSAMFSLVAASTAEPAVKLTGIALVGGRPVVLLEIKPVRGPLMRPTLVQGERVEGVQVISIDARTAKVTVKVDDSPTDLSMDAGDAAGPAPAFRLKDAHWRQVLDLYQNLSGRTVIAPHSLPVASITSTSEGAPGDAAAAEALAQALGDQGIAVSPRFPKFAFATTPSYLPRLAEFKDPPAVVNESKVDKKSAASANEKEELLPPGLIIFSEADLSQVLNIYQELTGRTLIQGPNLPPAKITFKSQTVLTRSEATWLVEATLKLAGTTATTQFEKFAFVTAPSDGPRLARIKPPPAPPGDSKVQGLAPGLMKFSEADLNQVLAVYQSLSGFTAIAGPDLPPVRITLRSQTELTSDEALWLIESAFQLRGIQFLSAVDKQVKIIREPGPDAANN